MTRLRIAVLALASAAVAAVSAIALAPGTGAQSDEPPPPLGTQTSAEVTRMLGEMSAGNIEEYDRTLVSFGRATRSRRRPTRSEGSGPRATTSTAR